MEEEASEVGGPPAPRNTNEEEGQVDEEEDSSDCSSVDRREFGIYACLPVEPGEPDWEQDDPQSVEEYLRRVRYEARHLPEVVTAPAPPEPRGDQQTAAGAPVGQQGRRTREHLSRHLLTMADDTGIQPCDPSLKPSAAWIHEFLRQFAQLRRRLQREYELTSGQAAAAPPGTHRLLLSQAALEAAAAEELAALQLDPPSAAMPELQQLRGLDQVQVRRQLHTAIQSAVQQEALAPEAAASLYALSARMDKPLPAGTSALYRDLLRCCAAQRAALGADGGGAAAAHPRLPHLNILIAVVGAYFGQDEELAGMWEGDEE